MTLQTLAKQFSAIGVQSSLVTGVYDTTVDRESTYEMLKARTVGNQLGRAIIRGVMGSILGGRR